MLAVSQLAQLINILRQQGTQEETLMRTSISSTLDLSYAILKILLMMAVEVLFWTIHFICGFLTIGFGFIGAVLEATLHRTFPEIYK